MPQYICQVPQAPVRTDPSDPSEICTFLLYGESCTVLEEHSSGRWKRIKIDHDGYEGWVDPKQITELEFPVESTRVKSRSALVVQGGQEMVLPMGALVSHRIGDRVLQGEFGSILPDDILHQARLLMGVSYLWGGRSSFGIDCSGLMQLIFGLAGFQLPRDAWQQAEAVDSVSFDARQEGDLAFFSNAKGRIIHVGVLSSSGHIIHAHGWVKESLFDAKGIFADDEKSYSHNYHSIGRVKR